MNTKIPSLVLQELIATLDIPPWAYEKVKERYLDLSQWFARPESACAVYSPHLYPQGSFRLGTVNRPLNEDGGYDLDMGSRLRRGITKSTHTQRQLKRLVGLDLEAYRQARRIESKLEEMHRCWRLPYKDKLAFHIDAVPSIPEDLQRRQALTQAMIRAGLASSLADALATHAGAITDDRHPNYDVIALDWRISNSEGFALWFESRMKLAQQLLEARAIQARVARIDDLPAMEWHSPLQRVIQLLKRHRDVMFEDDPDGQPISIIITTLASRAYQGEQDLAEALARVLADMGSYVSASMPRVANPVNPVEDFADKWHDPKYRHLNLEQNFWDWLRQAQSDFRLLTTSRDLAVIKEQALAKFAAHLPEDRLRDILGLVAPAVVTTPKTHVIHEPAKPWARFNA